MSKTKQSLPEDYDGTTHIEPSYAPGEPQEHEITVSVLKRPKTAGQKLLEAIEEEQERRKWEISKFLDSEIKEEYFKRFPF